MDPFATLGLERTYELDLRAAEKVHRDLSQALHPDRYASAGPREKREAMERAVAVNEAWRVVRDPIRRAEALFGLAGIEVGETNEPKPSPALLMDVMELREALAEAKRKRDAARVEEMVKDVGGRADRVKEELGRAFTEAEGDKRRLAALIGKLGELRYYQRFLDEADLVLSDLEEGTH